MHFEAYEDNAGSIHLFGLDGERVAWGQTYSAALADIYSGWDFPELAGMDWAHIVLCGESPVLSGWDNLPGREGLYRELTEVFPAKQIADSGWTHYPLGIDLASCCRGGQAFAIAAGVACRCPECGELLPARMDSSPCGFSLPTTCDACDATFALADL